MKSFIYVTLWTILFVISGFYLEYDLERFVSSYSDDVNRVEELIINDKYDLARKEVLTITKEFNEHKSKWYKLIDHTYYNDILFCLHVLENDANLEDKSLYLEYINRIKNGFVNMLQDEICDMNHVF